MKTLTNSVPIVLAPVRPLWIRILAFLLWPPVLWYQRAQTRFELESLTEEQLRDVGLDRDDVRREAAKPFWRA